MLLDFFLGPKRSKCAYWCFLVCIFYFLAVLDFVSEEAIDDACVVGAYLSDADLLLASLNGMVARNFEAENVVQSAAASVAVRGVLFGNSRLVPSRYCFVTRLAFSFKLVCYLNFIYFIEHVGGILFAVQSFGRPNNLCGTIRLD